ncbi:VIT domain-containing protein [Roseateles sp. NT4]|uniref:VIT domain-containing protein n=1 Tax=Roseateles sp. NT4 TaxID=3453715 RepID=UPI003EED5248
MPTATTLRLLLALLTLAASAAFALSPPPPPVKPPPPIAPLMPRFVVPDAAQPLTLQRVNVQATLAGAQAQTRIEVVVHNPNPRQLEATLEFPLDAGQSVVGFALDIRGEMVGAVPVPKDKGRQVFDDISRRRVDPALLERTAGNNFKLRIYPVPPNGERRVMLQLAETLHPDSQGRLQYRLPLNFGQPIAQFDGRFDLRGGNKPQPGGALAGVETFARGDQTSMQLQRRGWLPREALTLSWVGSGGDSVVVQEHLGQVYAYAELAAPEGPRGPARLPRELNLVWDASGSGAERDHARELALLDALFSAARDVRVHLTVARDAAEPVRVFDVRAGDWQALRRTLMQLPYDGASSPGAWLKGLSAAAPGAGTMSLLFSDGLATWPALGAKPPAGPVFTVNAASRADLPRLRRLAETSGACLLDLNRMDTAAALTALTRPGLQVVDVRGAGVEGIEDVVVESLHPENGRIAIAARLTVVTGRLLVTLADGEGRRSQRRIELKAPTESPPSDEATLPLAARRWAELRVAELSAEQQRNRAQIRRLGEQFRLLSAETSLIVLDELADYVRYEIVPPTAAMRTAYQRSIGQRDSTRQVDRESHVESLVRRFAERQAWWSREFPQRPAEPVPTVAVQIIPAPATPVPPPPPPRRPAQAPKMASESAQAVTLNAPPPAVAEMRPAPAPAPVAPAPARMTAPALQSAQLADARVVREDVTGGQATAPAASIALRAWEPNAAYVRRLREAGDAERYAIYLDERPGYLSSTAFFIDAAEIFFAKGQRELALRVLSNLAEMELENRHILRILAYRLLQAEEMALAVPLLERVRELAPDEPQSSRDLGLALAATQPQRAVDLLWDVASNPWDSRFADIDLIALTELNAIAARTPKLDLSRVDARLRRNLPLDLRTVLTWDADNTDIDLWVTDPDGEKAYYGNRLTRQGGAMSRDFTGGYGPEEFSLRRAKPGRYEVRAQFFGHRQQLVSPYTTLMLWLSTGFGTPGQKDERVVLRLSGSGQQVLVGSFEVAPRPEAK